MRRMPLGSRGWRCCFPDDFPQDLLSSCGRSGSMLPPRGPSGIALCLGLRFPLPRLWSTCDSQAPLNQPASVYLYSHFYPPDNTGNGPTVPRFSRPSRTQRGQNPPCRDGQTPQTAGSKTEASIPLPRTVPSQVLSPAPSPGACDGGFGPPLCLPAPSHQPAPSVPPGWGWGHLMHQHHVDSSLEFVSPAAIHPS